MWHSAVPLLVSPNSLKYECLIDQNADNDGPEDLIQQTFFGELQRVVQLDLPKSSEIHHPQAKTILLTHIKTCEATKNEDGFWEYSTIKPSPHFVDLNTIVCVVGRIHDRGHWTFIDRSGPTAHVEMVSLPSSSQSSDITDFSTSDESDSDEDGELAFDEDDKSEFSSMLVSSSASVGGSPMDLGTSSAESSE